MEFTKSDLIKLKDTFRSKLDENISANDRKKYEEMLFNIDMALSDDKSSDKSPNNNHKITPWMSKTYHFHDIFNLLEKFNQPDTIVSLRTILKSINDSSTKLEALDNVQLLFAHYVLYLSQLNVKDWTNCATTLTTCATCLMQFQTDLGIVNMQLLRLQFMFQFRSIDIWIREK